MAELMEATLVGSYAGQQCINRWNYVANGTPAAVTLSFALMSVMGFLPLDESLTNGTIGGEIQDLVNEGFIFRQAIVRAVYLDDDFYDSPFLSNTVGEGSALASGVSPLDAYGFRSTRVKQSIGRGYKRFAGVSEDHITSLGVIASGALGQMGVLAGLMGDTLTYDDEGNSLTFVPCIVQKEKYVVEESEKFAYRYYASQATQLTHTAQGVEWSAYDTVRSQTSRQYGRGA